jgi:transketolase
MTGPDVAVVESSVVGTSAAAISSALSDRPHRLLSIGVPRTEHRKYGTPADHNEAHGLSARGIRERLASWLER